MSSQTQPKRRKRDNGEGTYYKSGNRTIGEVVIDRKRYRVRADNKTEAQRMVRELKRKHERGETLTQPGATVADLVEHWRTVELPARRISDATRTRFDGHCRLLVSDDLGIGKTRLTALRAEHVEAMYDRLVRQRGWSKASLRSLRSTLNQILRFGERRSLLDRNIASITVIPAAAAPEVRGESLTPEQARKLWDACGDHRYGPMWRVQLMTGLRPGEVAGLLWSSVDLDSETPSVTISRMARVDKRGRTVLGEGVKTDGSYRTVQLPPELVDVLRVHRQRQRLERMEASSWENPDLVFCTEVGTVLSPSNVRREFAKLLADNELPPITPNELRHTAASIMYDAGMTMGQIADVLGHNSTRMLERHYRHRLRPVLGDHVAVMSSVFGGRS